MEMKPGQIVFSRKGRDVGTVYVVVSLSQNRVSLANGCKRTLSAPKIKNIRHIAPTKTVLTMGEVQTDQMLQVALAAYHKDCGPKTSGG